MDAETRRKRLTELRRVVADAPPERFNMKVFSCPSSCGTIHCAGGWAAMDQWHRENTEILDVFNVESDGKFDFVSPARPMLVTALLLAKLYGIEEKDARHLFGLGGVSGVVPKKHVLENIDRLLAGLPAAAYSDYRAFSEEGQ